MADISKIKLGSTTYNVKDGSAITNITRSGTTFTATKRDGTTFTFSQQDNNTTYSASNGVSLSGTTFSNSGVRSIATGSSNGTISVNTNGTSADVAVKGLGTAAYTASTAYATSGHTHATSIATSTGTNQITLAANTKYSITAGGTSYIFTTPPDTNTTYNFSGTAFTSNNYTGQDANNVSYNSHSYYTSNGPATSLGASTNDGALYTQAYSTSWIGQIAQDYRNGGLYVRGKNNGTWQSWYKVLDTRNTTTTSIGSASGWSAGSVPTLGTAIAADDITAWTTNTPTSISYTSRSIPNVTAAGTASYANGILTITNTTLGTAISADDITAYTAGTAASLSYTARSIPNVTSVGSAPSLTVTSVANVRKDV